jgi:hypothetical protein
MLRRREGGREQGAVDTKGWKPLTGSTVRRVGLEVGNPIALYVEDIYNRDGVSFEN